MLAISSRSSRRQFYHSSAPMTAGSASHRGVYSSVDEIFSLIKVLILQEWKVPLESSSGNPPWQGDVSPILDILSNGAILDTTTGKGRQTACNAFCSNQSFKFFGWQSIIKAFSNGRASRRVNKGRRVRVAGPDERLNVNGYKTHMEPMNTLSYGDTVNGSVKPYKTLKWIVCGIFLTKVSCLNISVELLMNQNV